MTGFREECAGGSAQDRQIAPTATVGERMMVFQEHDEDMKPTGRSFL